MSDQAITRTLLVVEDDTAVRDTIGLMCEIWGYNTLMFSNGFEVTEWLNEDELSPPLPDLALLDIRLPGPRCLRSQGALWCGQSTLQAPPRDEAVARAFRGSLSPARRQLNPQRW